MIDRTFCTTPWRVFLDWSCDVRPGEPCVEGLLQEQKSSLILSYPKRAPKNGKIDITWQPSPTRWGAALIAYQYQFTFMCVCVLLLLLLRGFELSVSSSFKHGLFIPLSYTFYLLFSLSLSLYPLRDEMDNLDCLPFGSFRTTPPFTASPSSGT